MPWLRSPVKLFGCTALLLLALRLLFPPADYAGALQAHSYFDFLGARLDLTGYGLFEFAAVVFLVSALAYYLTERLTHHRPNAALIQLHFWPSLLFALFAVFIAHWVNRTSSGALDDPVTQSSIKHWLYAFSCAFFVFIVLQVLYAIGALRSIWLSRKAVGAATQRNNGRTMPSPWNEHPKLRGRFRPEFPDDLQVIVHDGGPVTSDRQPELMWVRVVECQDGVFSGIVLNSPTQLKSVTQGSVIQFIVPEGGQYPVQVNRKYLQERSAWRLLVPCKKCGLTELLDPPSQLLASSFPSITADQLSQGFTFTTRCGLCGGAVVVRLKRTNWTWSEAKP